MTSAYGFTARPTAPSDCPKCHIVRSVFNGKRKLCARGKRLDEAVRLAYSAAIGTGDTSPEAHAYSDASRALREHHSQA